MGIGVLQPPSCLIREGGEKEKEEAFYVLDPSSLGEYMKGGKNRKRGKKGKSVLTF